MINNDILKRIKYSFEFSDKDVINIFSLVSYKITQEQLSSWLKAEGTEGFIPLLDNKLAEFLNGFIAKKRGKKDGEKPVAEKKLNNNIILRKLKIALNLKDTDLLELFKLGGVNLSKHELSAFFRKPTQTQYRPFMDQYMRKFLHGVQVKYRRAQA